MTEHVHPIEEKLDGYVVISHGIAEGHIALGGTSQNAAQLKLWQSDTRDSDLGWAIVNFRRARELACQSGQFDVPSESEIEQQLVQG